MEITRNWFKTQRWVDFNNVFLLVGEIEEIHDLSKSNYIINYKLDNKIYSYEDGYEDLSLKKLESILASYLDEHKNKLVCSIFFGYIFKYKMSKLVVDKPLYPSILENNNIFEMKIEKEVLGKQWIEDETFSDSQQKDIKLVMEQLNIDRDISISLLKKYNWDIVNAIVYFSEEKKIPLQYETGVDKYSSFGTKCEEVNQSIVPIGTIDEYPAVKVIVKTALKSISNATTDLSPFMFGMIRDVLSKTVYSNLSDHDIVSIIEEQNKLLEIETKIQIEKKMYV